MSKHKRGSRRILILLITFPLLLALNSGMALGDVNGDNLLDAVFANDGTDRVCLGDGTGSFACRDVSSDINPSRDVALGLVDGDPHLDAVFANGSSSANISTPNRVCLGDGAGGFACRDVTSDFNNSRGVALGLVDGDPHLDAVFANTQFGGVSDQVCLGDGIGGFSCSNMSADATQSHQGVALGLVDGDNFLDAVFGGGNYQVCLGDGTGGFSCSEFLSGRSSTGVALGDVNGDRRLDAVFGNDLSASDVCLGDGTGGFSCTGIGIETRDARDVALGDLNGDGRLDAVFAQGILSQVCLGDGAGGFTCSDVSVSLDPFGTNDFGVALGDVNRDQHLDAIFAILDLIPNRVCLGNGAGGFTCRDVSADSDRSFAVALKGPPRFVVIDGCETDVPNQLVDNQHTISDLILQCAAGTRNHGQFVSCVAHLTNGLKKAGMISGQDKGAIMSCAGQAAIP